jgi:hypothetical protein
VSPTQRAFAVVASAVTLGVVLELIRRRRLREEYAFLWVLTTVGMLVLSSWYGILEWITHVIGAVAVTTTLFIFSILFLLLITVHFTTVLSRLTVQVRRLAQELALIDAERNARPAPERGAASDSPRLDG